MLLENRLQDLSAESWQFYASISLSLQHMYIYYFYFIFVSLYALSTCWYFQFQPNIREFILAFLLSIFISLISWQWNLAPIILNIFTCLLILEYTESSVKTAKLSHCKIKLTD